MNCPHQFLTKVIDRLGMMTENDDGTVTAPVLEAHYECTDCRTIVRHTVNEQARRDYDEHFTLMTKLEEAITRSMAAIRAIESLEFFKPRLGKRPEPKSITQGDQP